MSEHVETLIIGAGPAGLQMAYFLHRAGRSYVILEAAAQAGSLFEKYPRHRRLISLNKRHNFYQEPEYNLRHDWNSLLSDDPELLFSRYSDELFPAADDYLRYLRDYATKLGLHIRYRTRARSVRSRDGGGFAIATESGDELTADRVMVATGPVAEHVPSDIVGIEHAETYGSHDIDPRQYENKRVCVIGGKNSALEVANHLAGHAAIITMALRSPLRHAWNTHFPGDIRAINAAFLDMFQLKSLHATIGLVVKEIQRRPDGSLLLRTEVDVPHWDPPTTLRANLVVDAVIVCTGFRYIDPTLFEGISPEVSACGRLPVLSPYWESTVPGLYFIGTSMLARDRNTASGFIHGFRYNIRALFRYLELTHHDVPLPNVTWPVRGGDVDLCAVAQRIVERLTTADGLYPLRGFLCDLLTFDGEKIAFEHELPIDALFSADDPHGFRDREHAVVVYLEFGWTDGAARGRTRRYPRGRMPIEYILPSDHARPECSAFLHPVFEYYRRGELVSELHLQESLVVRFVEDDYEDFNPNVNRNRVHNFLAACFGLSREKLPEEYVPHDRRDQTYVPWSPERLEAASRDPDKRRCGSASHATVVGAGSDSAE